MDSSTYKRHLPSKNPDCILVGTFRKSSGSRRWLRVTRDELIHVHCFCIREGVLNWSVDLTEEI